MKLLAKFFRHKARGTRYEVLGEARVQAAKPLRDLDLVVVYRDEEGRVWVRASGEFFDGRFEAVEE